MVDLVKIGKFIAEKRKEKGYTQFSLAEELNITDRAISKWENGKSMPDSSIMLELCSKLGISVNDLLSGEVVEMKEYNEKLEQNLIDMVKQKEERDKRLLSLEIVMGLLLFAIFFTLMIIASYLDVDDNVRFMLIMVGFVPFVIMAFFAIRIEQVAGYYECNKCYHKYVPTYSGVLWAMHFGRTRYMKCPECKKWSWQHKVISKD